MPVRGIAGSFSMKSAVLWAVDPELHVVFFAADHVIVPLLAVEEFFDVRRGWRHGEGLAPPAFVIDASPVALAQIGLVADHFAVVGNSLRPDLNAGVGLRAAEDFGTSAAVRNHRTAASSRENSLRPSDFFKLPANDRAVLDMEDFQVPFPALEALAVEQRHETAWVREFLIGQGERGEK